MKKFLAGALLGLMLTACTSSPPATQPTSEPTVKILQTPASQIETTPTPTQSAKPSSSSSRDPNLVISPTSSGKASAKPSSSTGPQTMEKMIIFEFSTEGTSAKIKIANSKTSKKAEQPLDSGKKISAIMDLQKGDTLTLTILADNPSADSVISCRITKVNSEKPSEASVLVEKIEKNEKKAVCSWTSK